MLQRIRQIRRIRWQNAVFNRRIRWPTQGRNEQTQFKSTSYQRHAFQRIRRLRSVYVIFAVYFTLDFTTYRAMNSRISAPLVSLNALVAIGIAFAIYTTYRGIEVSERSNYLWTACFSYCVAWWIERDRKSKGFSAPFEYQAFVFILWPFVAPYYFFKTRGWRGLALGLGLFLYACVPGAAQLATYLLISENL